MGRGIRDPLRGREQGKGREVEGVRGNIGGKGMRERGRGNEEGRGTERG